VWRDLPAWETASALTLTSVDGGAAEHLVIVVAHPDDGMLAVGGLIHEAGRRGLRTTVLVASDGTWSEDRGRADSDDVREVRRAELAAALGILNPTAEHRWLGLGYGRVAESVARLEAELSAIADPATVIVSTWRHDGHPDHEAVGRAAATAAARAGCRHLEAPIRAWSWAGPADLPWERVRLLHFPPAAAHRKAEALAAYPGRFDSDHARGAAPVTEHVRRPFEPFLDSTPLPLAEPVEQELLERMYAVGEPPGRHERSWYESRKRAITLAALPTEGLGRVLEIGPGSGLLTVELARRADELVSVDVCTDALRGARRRLAEEDLGERVEMLHGRVPDVWPAGRFDAVVVSEVAYYLTPGEWATTLRLIRGALAESGALVLVHWADRLPQCPLDTETAHDLAVDVTGLRTTIHHVEEDFVLRVLRPPGLMSVAAAERWGDRD
jgi:LmbE family N-acetylglucosaminyl deacetylase/protein-L-isoaspartate O-methyltransferase